jgi:hypothetical protein
MKRPAADLLMMAAMMGAMGGGSPATGRRPRYLREDYRNPQPKNTDNSPDRAKGMREFWVKDGAIVWQPGDQPADPDGAVLIWAGTPKAAIKKANLLSKTTP